MNFKIQSTMTKWCNGSENLQMLPQGVYESNKCKVFSSKVEDPNSDTHLHWTPKFEWFVVWCGSKKRHQKGIMCLKEIGLACSKYDNHSRLNSRHNWRGGDTYMTI